MVCRLPYDSDSHLYGPWTLKAQAYFLQQQIQPTKWWGIASAITLLAIGTTMRGLIACGFRKVHVENLDTLINTIEDPNRDRPVITCKFSYFNY